MKKFAILILGLSLTAASCNIVEVILGTSSGVRGVFRSEDNGESFRAANLIGKKGNINNLSVTSVALSSSNPDTIYLGSNDGLYKSEDGAKSWVYILAGIAVADVVVDPVEANIVYAAGIAGGNGKVIKSSDSGSSWIDVYTEPSKNNAVLSLAVSKFNTSIVLAGLNGGEIIRSTDAGHTWQGVKDLADKVMRLRFGPSGTAYVLTAKVGLAKSSDLGANWIQLTNNLTNTSFNTSSRAISTVSGFYDLGLDRKQPGVLYLGTEQGLYRSINDGVNWSFMELPVKNNALRVSSIAINPDNSNSIFAGIGAAVFKSTNGGVTWQTKVLPTNSEIRNLVINPTSNNIIYAGLSAPRSAQ